MDENDELDHNDEDPHSPFYGLSEEEKSKLMEAIMKSNTPRSKIKGRQLPSRKAPK
jgi:hypothetical protein